MLPGRDGPAICRAIRAAGLPAALLMLTARIQIEDRVAGLDSGTDDYLVKPFAFDELLARLRALSRRFSTLAGDAWELRYGDLVMDLRARKARRGQVPLNLTHTEWKLLEFLMRHPRQTLTRQQIGWTGDTHGRGCVDINYVPRRKWADHSFSGWNGSHGFDVRNRGCSKKRARPAYSQIFRWLIYTLLDLSFAGRGRGCFLPPNCAETIHSGPDHQSAFHAGHLFGSAGGLVDRTV